MDDPLTPLELATSKYPEVARLAFQDAVDAARNLVRFLQDAGEDIAEMTPEDMSLFSENDLEYEEDQEEYSALEEEFKKAFFSFLEALDNAAGTHVSPETQDSIEEEINEIVLSELSPIQARQEDNKETAAPAIEAGIIAEGSEWREKLHQSGQITRIITGPDDSPQYSNHTFLQVMLREEALPRNDALRKHAVDDLARHIQQMTLEAGLEPDDVKSGNTSK